MLSHASWIRNIIRGGKVKIDYGAGDRDDGDHDEGHYHYHQLCDQPSSLLSLMNNDLVTFGKIIINFINRIKNTDIKT